MKNTDTWEFWFLTGSQHLYGEAALRQVADNGRCLVEGLNASARLPVAHAPWAPRPNLKTAAAAWLYAGGPHRTVFSQAATAEHVEDFAEMAGVPCLFIDAQTRLRELKQQLA